MYITFLKNAASTTQRQKSDGRKLVGPITGKKRSKNVAPTSVHSGFLRFHVN